MREGLAKNAIVLGARDLLDDNLDREGEFDFLVGRQIDLATLERARALARHWDVPLERVLLSTGWVTPEDYARSLARVLGVPAAEDEGRAPRGCRLVDATLGGPCVVESAVRRLQRQGDPVALTAGPGTTVVTPDTPGESGVSHALEGVARRAPVLTARGGPWLWQQFAIVLVVGAFLGMALIDAPLAYFAVSLVAAIPFAFIVAQRIAVLVTAAGGFSRPLQPTALPRLPDGALQMHTVLVPLFREAEVLPDLVAALRRLSFPAAKLDILLVLEEVDQETRAAAARLRLPPFMRIVIVPESQPRTKPKAMNYALQYARGAFVSVYDAEDLPHPRQLRDVQATFASSRDEVVCVQAKLNIHNRTASWFSRQFTLEYSALFDSMLPGLAAIGSPLMLGGTSNHFRRDALEALGAWDPFNVTEDADLGLRISRAGFDVALLDSTTWEEAPETLRVWLPQRTRWLKGWMQTYLVHTRQPLRLFADLGPWRFLMLQCLLGGFLLSALMHPLFYVLVVLEVLGGEPFAAGGTLFEVTLWYMALFNLMAGFTSAMLLAAVSVVRRRFVGLLFDVALMPAHWLLISVAAYRALWQLVVAPHVWEKTRHRARRSITPQPASLKWPVASFKPGHS